MTSSLHFRSKIPRKKFALSFLGSLILGLFFLPQASLLAQSPEDGKTKFGMFCVACHTIGGGPLAGPDLKGVTTKRDEQWLVRWIQEPDKMVAEGDPLAKQLLQEFNNVPMPNFGLSQDVAKDILAYIAAESGSPSVESTTSTTESTADAASTVKSTPVVPDPAIGKALFIGKQSFENGGPACISCHSTTDVGGLGGGTLGPDLTKVHTRFGGDLGLKPVLISLPFPTMLGVFSKKPVSNDEATHLTAYFAKTNSLEEKASMDFIISGISVLGLIFLFFLIHLIWRKRLTGVRIPLVGR
ncbi:c-type cytochrome [Candidatus Parabeggiatoa sp. HSG14]|uniref:c-type cytochrome n=1 Tax=Candidatus Parabeggiatoa sp. HSG14 TaxID=3055593 RepID=UPI0025A72570|nr:c-type cytochrome [Thiotrichales bacterium HSG14]